jgi:DNA invertase Pin-like site-specific DNA recombinase
MNKPALKSGEIAKRRFGLYVRVSDQRQIEGVKYDSLESQEDVLRRYVRERPGVAPEIFKVYRDTESGTKLEERTGLMALLADAEAGLIDEAVAYNLDRWHRSIEIFALMKSVTKRSGVRFTSATQQFDDSAEGEMMETQLATFAQYFSRLVGQKVHIKRQARFRLGKWNGGTCPYGYKSEAGELTPHPEEAPVLRQMFDMYLEHGSFAGVRERLKALGIKHRKGNAWSAKTIDWMIRNPIYAGIVHEGAESRPGTHEALVTREVFDAAQRLTPTRERILATKKYQRFFPLRRLLFCGHCKVGMMPHRAIGRGGKSYPRYRCEHTMSRSWADCPVKEIRAEEMEEWVMAQFSTITASQALLDATIAAANSGSAEEAKPLREKCGAIEDRLREVQAKEANLVNAIAAGGSFDAVRAALASEQANRHMLENERDALKRQIDALDGKPIDPARVREVLGDFRLLYEAATDEERARLLRLLVVRIDFHGKNGNVVVKFRDDVNFNAPVRSHGVKWLLGLDSNQGPAD